MIKKFEQILIDKTATVKESMKRLDKTAEKILFVVQDKNKLFGSLTDGDIRRWILNGGSLNDPVREVCYKGTFFVQRNYSISNVKAEMLKRKIVYVPVVNEKKEVIEFIIWDKIFEGKIVRKTSSKLDVEVVIMAGGKGTRLEPFTKVLPKPLVPINDRTVLELIIDRFLEHGISHFYISVNYKANIIKSYLDELSPEYKIDYIYEDKPLGTAGSLYRLKDKVNKDIILTNCDIIIDANYNDLYEHHLKSKNDITLVASVKHYSIPYGVCDIENGGILLRIEEKPEYNFLVNTGMYILNKEVLHYIPENEFFHMTHLIEKVKNLGLKVGVYPISDDAWVDIGEWSEYKNVIKNLVT